MKNKILKNLGFFLILLFAIFGFSKSSYGLTISTQNPYEQNPYNNERITSSIQTDTNSGSIMYAQLVDSTRKEFISQYYMTAYKDGKPETVIYNTNGTTASNEFNDDTLYGVLDSNGVMQPATADPIKNSEQDKAFQNSIDPNLYAKIYGADGTGTTSGVDQAANRGQQTPLDTQECFNWSLTKGLFNLDACLADGANILLKISSYFLWLSGVFFNHTIEYSLNMGDFIKGLPIVDIGWKILRDVANLCFIFVLLLIGIQTIFQAGGYQTKKLLGTVVIVAILLNFSLLFTKIVIDTSNILALQFYNKIGTAGGNPNSLDGGVSAAFMKGMGLSSIYTAGSSQNTDSNTPIIPPTSRNIILIGIGGSILIMVAAFTFFAGAIMFIIRTIVLVFVMILSPLAFVSLALPSMSGQFDKWRKTLISQAFFAPIYMMIIYIVVATINGNFGSVTTNGGLTTTKNFADLLTGGESSIGTLYTFVVMIGLLLGSLIVSKQMGAYGGDFARNWAGKATFGLGAFAGRQTAGRVFEKWAKSDTMQRWKNSNGLGIKRGISGLIDNRAKGTWDLRNTSIGKLADKQAGGLGTVGGVGGIQKEIEDAKKRTTEAAKQAVIKKKKDELDAALNKTYPSVADRDEAIQKALNEFTDSQYAELGSELLSKDEIIRNSRYSQIKAAIDEKNTNLNDTQKEKMTGIRLKALNEALVLPAGTPAEILSRNNAIKKAYNELDGSDEKSSIPLETLMRPEVLRYVDKDVVDKVKMTPAQKTALQEAKATTLMGALTPAGTLTHNPDLADSIMKNLKGDELAKMHNSTGVGAGLLSNSEIMDRLKDTQISEIGKSDLDPAIKTSIGSYIGGPTSTHGLKKKFAKAAPGVAATPGIPGVAAVNEGAYYSMFPW